MSRLLFALALFLTLGSVGAADTEMRTFPLQNRSAQEMIPILRPMVDPRGSITGTGYTLIVRSTRQNLDEIGQLVRELDAALRNLIITVRHGELSEQERQGIEATGTVRAGDGKVTVGKDGNPRVRIYRTERRDEDNGHQRLRVLEGQWARVQSGQEIPLPQRNVVHGAGGTVVQESIEYRDVSSGFEVRPRLNGERVTVDVRPYRNRPAATGGGAIETAQMITTVSGRLGEWIELGGVADENTSRGSGILRSTERRERLENTTYIRIEAIE